MNSILKAVIFDVIHWNC